MKTIIANRATNIMSLLNNYSEIQIVLNNSTNRELEIRVESHSLIIESITKTIIEPIIYKC